MDINSIKRKLLIKYPFFGSIVANSKFIEETSIHAAATDGKDIYYNPIYLETLSTDEQVFAFAHEVCHIAFNHVYRSEGKEEKAWNIATDSVVNALLKQDGLPLIEGTVDIPEAINYDAETMYNKLLEEAKKQAENNMQQSISSSDNNEPNNQENNGQQSNGSSEDKKENNSSEENKNQDNDEPNNQENKEQGNASSEDNKENNPSEENKNQDNDEPNNQENKEQGNDSSGDKKENNSSEENKNQENDEPNNQENKEQSNGSSEDNKNQNSDTQSDNNDSESGKDENTNDVGHDTHSMWKKAVEEKHQEEKNSKEAEQPQKEQDAFKKNKEEREKALEGLRRSLASKSHGYGTEDVDSGYRDVGDIGTAKPLIDWRHALKESIKYDIDWSFQNADIEDGVVTPHLEEQPRPETEIVLDTSGSINKELLRNFLRECKNIIQTSNVKVGCFDTRFYGFTEVKDVHGIDELEFPGGGNTNFNVAVEAFSKRVENKIIFTDGDAPNPIMPLDVIWIVFGPKRINPPGGKVIYIDKEQLEDLYNLEVESKRKKTL